MRETLKRSSLLFVGLASLLALGCPVSLPGCSGGNTPSWSLDGTNTTESTWVVQQTAKSKVAVVFVHGIFGDTIGTWTNPSGARFFDLLNTVPGIAGRTDMLAFGFPSAMFTSGSFDIREAANSLHLRLEFHGVLEYPKVVFVAHSMGGLVVLRELLTHPEVRSRVPVIVLFGTPQEGAQIALLAGHIANNPALAQMRPADANDLLKSLSDDWSVIPPAARTPVRCAYEGLDTYGVRIVPWSSATRFCEGGPPPIKANHIDMVKPANADSDAVAVVATALQTYVLNQALEPRLETPDFRTEGDHLAIDLTSVAPPQRARLVNAGGSSLRYTLTGISDPHLYLWPDDTPKELPANGREDLQIGLGIGATATEYQFVLQAANEPERHIVVHVPNMAALTGQQVQLAQNVNTALGQLLANPDVNARITAAAAEDPAALDLVARTVHDTIAAATPQVPDSGHWVLAADLLNSMNWPGLAVRALRQAEQVSPGVATTPSVQHLGAMAGYLSGEHQVFARAPTPIIDPASAEAAHTSANILVKAVGTDRSVALAAGLEKVPSLKVYGFSLRGDAQQAAGKVDEAQHAWREATMIRPTPSVKNRIKAGFVG